MTKQLLDDEHLMSLLSEAMTGDEPVPSDVLAAAYASFTWRTIDGELAGLIYDSSIQEPSRSGVRSQQAGLRAMTFASSSLTIEIEVTPTSLMGQLVPAHTSEVFSIFQDGTGRSVPVDELGAFTIDPIPEDKFRLQVPGQPQVTTGWIVL